jgi:hypothetical protein
VICHDEYWQKLMTILLFLFVHHHLTRKKCDGFMVASTKTDIALGTVAIPHEGPEEYNNIWQKVRAMWSYVYDNYYEKVRTQMDKVYFLTFSFHFHFL